MRITALAAVIALIAFANTSHGQALDHGRTEIIQLKNGRTASGLLLSVDNGKIVLNRKVGKGSVRQTIPYKRIAAHSLYSILSAALSPLDEADHRRLADVSFDADLYATAARHYKKSAPSEDALAADVKRRIQKCYDADIIQLMKRSRDALANERFSVARRLGLLVMRRYRDHPEAKKIPGYIEQINRARQDARLREEALKRSKKAKAAWERGERELKRIDRWVFKAEETERKALRNSNRFREARTGLEIGIRYTRNAETEAGKLRQNTRLLPAGLRPQLAGLEEKAFEVRVRLRLHLASLYSVRGSYGTALHQVNLALALDPTDEKALAARARIETGAAAASARGFSRIR